MLEKIISMIIALLMLLTSSACGSLRKPEDGTTAATEPTVVTTVPGETEHTSDATTPGTETQPETEPATVPTEPTEPVTGPTVPVQTEPVVTEPPVTEPPATTPTEPAPTEPAHKHDYKKKVTQEATCSKSGIVTYTCGCGSQYTEKTSALGHRYTEEVVAPTTTSEGYTLHTCNRCGATYKDQITDKLPEPCETHQYRKQWVDKNCQQDGYTEYTCKVCGYSYRDNYDYHTPDDHRFWTNKPDEKKEATYEEDGYAKYKCIFCDYVHTIVYPKLEVIDTDTLEAYGRQYAENKYGYEGLKECNPSNNAGYFPGVYNQINTMEQGYAEVREAIDTQYRNDMGAGHKVYWEDENGIIYRQCINIELEPTDDPHVFIIWVYYGGDV